MSDADPMLPVSRRRLCAAGLAGAWAPLGRAEATSPRVALVIGNAAYVQGPLANPAHDARAMSALLRDLGFDVIELIDAGLVDMVHAVDQLRSRLAGRRGVGMLYYAGHGLQLDWRNHLMPVDARLERAADVPSQTLDVQRVIDALAAARTQVNIVVLDACRDNPFGGLSSGRGLAPLDAPPGSLLAYATAPGHLALDGGVQERNGLYTRFLLQEMRRREARVEDVFKRVRLQVRQASQGRQIPWESTSLEQDFFFDAGRQPPAPDPERRDAEFDAEKTEWDRIAASAQAEVFYNFLQRNPSGHISELAQFRLDQLVRPQVLPVAARPELQVLPAGMDRFRVGDVSIFERTDHADGGSRTRVVWRVTAIDGTRVLINGGASVMDQMGGILVNRFGTKEPALLGIPDGLQLGKRWRTAFTNTPRDRPPTRNYYECRVEAIEQIEVPAGRFHAFRIDASGEARSAQGGRRLKFVTWVDPATMLMVRHDVRFTTLRSEQVVEHSSDVLLSRRLVPRG